jgi:hypothetical protein
MSTEIYVRMAADADSFWDQAKDWLQVILAGLNSGRIANPQAQEIADLRKLCEELEFLRKPSDEQVQRLRKLQQTINPNPSPETVTAFGGAGYEATMDVIVKQHASRPEALDLRRAGLAYRYCSFLLEGVQRRSHSN